MNDIPTILFVDAITDEVIERKMTTEEHAEHKLLCEATKVYQADQDAKTSARESALEKLANLGLSLDEIAAL